MSKRHKTPPITAMSPAREAEAYQILKLSLEYDVKMGYLDRDEARIEIAPWKVSEAVENLMIN